MQHMNWDNLRYVLLLAKIGSIAETARELGVNRSTVLRRIDAFQKKLGCRIFERSASGYILTPEAERIIEAAEGIENTLFNMQRQIAGQELRLEGNLRVTTTDTVMDCFIGPYLASFHIEHPHIVVDIVMTNSVLDLNRRDADIAIRPTKSLEAHLVGEHLTDIGFGVYASADYLERAGDLPLFQHQWIGFDLALQTTAPAIWLQAKVPINKICIRGDSFIVTKAAAENGMGLALLPDFYAESIPELQRLQAPTNELATELWILTHRDLVRSAKVHAFIRHFAEAFNSAES